jgi:beta-lactamase regulating signal transducer with metallopeptidase domain
MPFFPDLDLTGLPLFLLEVSIKGSLILAVAGLATSLLKMAPAAVRHSIWTTALVVVAILPAIIAYSPRVDVGVLPADESRIIARPDISDHLDGQVAVTRTRERSHSHTSLAKPRKTRSVVRAPVSPLVAGPRTSQAGFNWKMALLTLWAFGMLVVTLRYVVGWIALLRIKKRSEPVADVRFRLASIKVARSIGLKRRVRFVYGDSSGMPLTWGWVRPTVLLPQDSREWEAEKTVSVLKHELGHIKRRDCLVQALVYLVCAIYWFNPLVWIAAASSRREREIACDDYVISGGTDGTAYADHLLDIARSLKSPKLSGVSTIAMARPSELEGRLMAILSSDRPRGANTKAGMFTTMGILAVVAIPLAALRPVPVEPSPVLWPAVSDVRVPSPVVPTPVISVETQEYLDEVNEIVEKAARTLESLERLEPTVSAWQAEFGDSDQTITRAILGQVILNPDTIPLYQINRLKAAGVDADYIAGLASVGLDHLTVDQLVLLAHAEVDAEYVRAFQSAGYRKLGPDELAQLGFADVDPDDIAIWADLGYDDLTTSELTRLAHADVDAEFITAMATLGYKNLGPDELVRMSHSDIDPEFVAEMQRAGYSNLAADDLIRLGHADIDADFVRELGKLGLKGLSADDLARMGHADIDADFVQGMRSAGYTELTADDLIRMAHADVDVEFIEELRELGFEVDDVDQIVRLRYMEIDPEYIQSIRKALEDN